MANVIFASWSNVNCERDIVNTLMWNRWIFRILGIWPLVYADISLIERILTTISFVLCWSALGFLLIPMIIYTLSEQTVKNEKMKMLGPVSYVIISLVKYFFLVVQRRNIRQCIRLLSADWRNVQHDDHRRIMIDDAAKGHVLSRFCVVFMYCGGLSYHTVMPFLAKRPDGNHNVTVKPIPYPGYDVIFDLHFTPAYVFIFCAQWLSSIVLFNISTAVCCTATTFVSHACGQIGIVMAQVENLVKDLQNNHVNSEQYIAAIVKHHVHALRFSANINNIFRELCLVEVGGSTMIICLLEYYCLTEWNNNDSIAILTYFFLLLSFVFNVFIFCYISELLTDQCKKVGHTTYKIEWYHLPGKIALNLTLLINMSHHPIQITAGKLINLSFSSFGNVLKTSIVYLNLLRTMV